MGNRFSKEKRHSKRCRASSPTEKAPLLASHNRPAPSPPSSAGPFPKAVKRQLDHYYDKIDPREDRYRRPTPSCGTNSSLANRPSTAASSYSFSGTLPRAGKPIPSASKPRFWKATGNGRAGARPKEYQLQIRCTGCAGREPCDLSRDLNLNAQNTSAYDKRNPHYDGEPKTWELSVDLCSFRRDSEQQRQKTKDVLRRFVGDRTYEDYEEMEKEKEPFCAQDLVTMLKREDVVYESVPSFPR
jgi:hypothetical protein